MLPFLLPIQIIDVPHRHSLHHSETMDCCQKIHTDEGLAVTLPQSILVSGQSDFSEYSRPTIHIIDVPHRHSLHHSETMDCCQKIHTDEGLAVTLPLSILASEVLTNLVPVRK
ncbi:Cytosolic Fe-S cluster assembly factor [Trichinella spiralis]|uniref:Cytosolic Fe-S cluster assembly factor n=1 Tax=Trichinella spiralis TaxID=6334 RepID=A0ABR3KGL5_TRISP